MKYLVPRVTRAATFVAVRIMPVSGMQMERTPANHPDNLYSRLEGIHSQPVFPREATGSARRPNRKVHARDGTHTWDDVEKSEPNKDYVHRRTNNGVSSPCADGNSRDPFTGERLKENAGYWGYEPEKAYAFGLKIQHAVRKRNLVAFFSLVGVELDYGPRRKYIENRTFREIFSDSWRAAVLNDEPSCTPVGWRGFMLGSGQVWYKGNDTFRIVSVSEWIPEEFAPTPVGWKVDGRLLLPQCFVYEWLSSDNFKAYAAHFSISKFDDFRSNTGKYFGNPIYPFTSIYRWDKEISLWQNVNDCTDDYGQIEINDFTIRRVSEEYKHSYDEYTILAEVSTFLCQDLAPYLPGRCLESYLVKLCSNFGGSMGCNMGYNIYGLFRMKSGQRLIFPLKNFDAENIARNFLDG